MCFAHNEKDQVFTWFSSWIHASVLLSYCFAWHMNERLPLYHARTLTNKQTLLPWVNWTLGLVGSWYWLWVLNSFCFQLFQTYVWYKIMDYFGFFFFSWEYFVKIIYICTSDLWSTTDGSLSQNKKKGIDLYWYFVNWEKATYSLIQPAY